MGRILRDPFITVVRVNLGYRTVANDRDTKLLPSIVVSHR